ncbi:MAG: GTP pyrophosphokinase family protein [Clostridiales bacterium]|jgi:putative GTP pyrophosphokinase|nr:GTP pyrophosphokinase family protein [Clostridiales bacterium]
MSAQFSDTEFTLLKDALTVYEWALKTLMTKLQIIHEDLKNFQGGSPIEHFKGRIKTPDSIAKKLQKLNLEITAENAKQRLQDIAGTRIICQFSKDIYSLVETLKSMPDCEVILEKDYVTNPKPSGYRSYHLIMNVPVFYSGKTEKIPVEVQIRTEAMDFWATLEHKVRYKYNEYIPAHLSDELIICADKIAELDNRMYLIHDIISLINQ